MLYFTFQLNSVRDLLKFCVYCGMYKQSVLMIHVSTKHHSGSEKFKLIIKANSEWT